MTNQPTFEGKPCRKCNGTLRYERCRQCVPCKIEARKNHRARYKEKISSDQEAYSDHLLRKKKSREQNKPYYSASRMRAYSFKISEEELHIWLNSTDGKCTICQETPERGLVIDHCHVTGKIRGVLCHHCNSGLGFMRDNTNYLSNAIEYLLSSKQ
jgi:hypothetical protein